MNRSALFLSGNQEPGTTGAVPARPGNLSFTIRQPE